VPVQFRLNVPARAIAVIALMPVSAVQAQRGPIQFGLEAGATRSDFIGSDAGVARARSSVFGGVTAVSHARGSMLGLQTGLHLISKGVAVNEGDVSGSFRLRYLEVPLLLRLSPTGNRTRSVPTITVGATLGARIACRIASNEDGLNGEFDCDSGFIGALIDFKRFDAGLSIGGEVAVPVRTQYLVVPMVRYTHGLTKIADSDTRDDVRNSTLQIGIGIRFRRE
jgi:Outer membrane protein beta-barrel domain